MLEGLESELVLVSVGPLRGRLQACLLLLNGKVAGDCQVLMTFWRFGNLLGDLLVDKMITVLHLKWHLVRGRDMRLLLHLMAYKAFALAIIDAES